MNVEESIATSQQKFIPFRLKPLEERQARFSKLTQGNAGKVPIIFERHPQSKLPKDHEVKFVSTRNLKLAYFADLLRSNLKLQPECALFFNAGRLRAVKHDILVGELYESEKSEDGFLYIQFREVESFGK